MADDSPQSTFLQAIGERLSHPVIGILTLSFLGWNWESIFFLFWSDLDAGARIVQARGYTNWATLLALPFVTTAVYVLASPVLRGAAVRYDSLVRKRVALGLFEDDVEVLENRLARLRQSLTFIKTEIEQHSELESQAALRVAGLRKEEAEMKHSAALMFSLESNENSILGDLMKGKTTLETQLGEKHLIWNQRFDLWAAIREELIATGKLKSKEQLKGYKPPKLPSYFPIRAKI